MEEEIILAVLEDLKGKTPEEKVLDIRRQLGVQMAEIETTYSLDILKGIIEARIIDSCPFCKGSGFNMEFQQCVICNGVGHLKAVEAERRILLWNKEKEQEKERLKEKVELFRKAYIILKEKMGVDFEKKNVKNNLLKRIDKLNMKIYLK